MKSKLEKSIEYIKGFCDKHENCDNCKLKDEETDKCIITNIPCEWLFNKAGEKND